MDFYLSPIRETQMEIVNQIAIVISSLSFLIYGGMLLKSEEMKKEFKRFQLEKFLVITGVLELLGGTGLLVGFFFDIILLISAGGLGLLMFFAFLVRLKMRDGFWISLPSVFFLVLNFFIFFSNLPKIQDIDLFRLDLDSNPRQEGTK